MEEKRKVWNTTPKEIVDSLVERNKNGETLDSIAKSLDKSPSTISKLFKRHNHIPILQENHMIKKWKCKNIMYFKNINNKEKAYYLGLIFADGCIYYPTKWSKCFTIGLKESDLYIIERLKELVGSKSKINYNKKSNSYKFSIHSKEFCNYLEKYGVIPNKSYKELNIPKINKRFLRSFLLGVFDGDGSIGIYKRSIIISICSSSIVFLTEIQNILKENEINSKVSIRKPKEENHHNLYTLTISTLQDKLNMVKYLYKGLNHICLERKRKIASDVNTVLNQKLNVFDQCNA